MARSAHLPAGRRAEKRVTAQEVSGQGHERKARWGLSSREKMDNCSIGRRGCVHEKLGEAL
jgi:hypothetical protein